MTDLLVKHAPTTERWDPPSPPTLPAARPERPKLPLVWLAVVLVGAASYLGWLDWLPMSARLALAAAIVFFLPGRCLARRLASREGLTVLERGALYGGSSIGIFALLTVLWIELHLGLRSLGWILLLGGGAWLGWEMRRDRGVAGTRSVRSPSPASPEPDRSRLPSDRDLSGLPLTRGYTWVGWMVLGLLAAICVAIYQIGGALGTVPVVEEIQHLTTIRKMWGNPSLTVTNFMWQPDTPFTYLYAPYHAMLALVALLSHLDPIVVYMKIRPLFAILSFGACYGILRLLRPERLAAEVGTLILMVLALTTVAGLVGFNNEAKFYWAQLIPLTHPGDFGLGVLLPLLVYFGLRYVLQGPLWSSRLWLFVLLAVGTITIHSRETLQILMYLGFWGAALLIVPSKGEIKAVGPKILVPILLILLAGVAYQARHHRVVTHVGHFDAPRMAQLKQYYKQLMKKPFGGMVETTTATHYNNVLLFRAPYGAWIVAAPLLLWPGWPLGVRLLGAIIWGFILTYRIPPLTYLVTAFTYSEIFDTPLRYIYFPALILTAYGGYLLVRWGERRLVTAEAAAERRFPGTIWKDLLLTAGVIAFVWGAGTAIWNKISVKLFLVPYGTFFLVFVLALLAWRHRPPLVRVLTDGIRVPPVLRAPWALSLVLAAVAAGCFALQQRPSLIRQYQDVAGHPHPIHEAAWYERSELEKVIPYRVITMVRDHVPAGSVVLIDYKTYFQLPLMANVYTVTSGQCYPTDRPFLMAVKTVRKEVVTRESILTMQYDLEYAYCSQSVSTVPPVFHPSYTDEQNLQFFRELKVDYVVYDDAKHPHLSSLAAREPARLHRVASTGSYRLFQVRRDS